MFFSESVQFVLFAAISLLSAAAGVVFAGTLQRRLNGDGEPTPRHRTENFDTQSRPTTREEKRYVFQGGVLTSAIEPDDALLAQDTDPEFALAALSEALEFLSRDLPELLTALARRGERFFRVGFLGPDALLVQGQTQEDTVVITVSPLHALGKPDPDGTLPITRLQRVADSFRQTVNFGPAVQWKQDETGRVIWADPAYLSLIERLGGDPGREFNWPLPRVFGDQLDPAPVEGTVRRCRVALQEGSEGGWFEVSAVAMGEGTLLFSAIPVDRLVTAEVDLREFIQTLSKTFATLPTGLAVFDRSRELVMFNPALVQLSQLDPAALSRRPTLRTFLDDLRNKQRMPEPRDYRSWREEIVRLEQGAAEGRYHELWTLPDGDSLRVTGHPHPDGAIAFLFEDISQEMVLTRRFRSELDLDRVILDDLGAAFVVFDRDGRVLRANTAYEAMIGVNRRSDGAIDETLKTAAQRWQDGVAPSRLWGEIRMFVLHEVDRAAWSELIPVPSGRDVHCRVAPLSGGLTIVWFLSALSDRSDPFVPGIWPEVSSRSVIDAPDTLPDRDEGAA